MLNVYVERNECQYRDFKNERNEWSSNGAERCEVNVLKSRTGVYYWINKGNIFRQIKQWKKSPDYLKIGRSDIFGGNKEAKDFVHKIANQIFIDCDPIGYQEILEQLHQKYSLCIKKNSRYKYISGNSKHLNSSWQLKLANNTSNQNIW